MHEGTGKVLEDLAAERAVLGAVLANNEIFDQVAAQVESDDFAHPAHAKIFASMRSLFDKSASIDHLTLAEQLKVEGNLATVGGPAYLMSLDQVVPLAQNGEEYARIVKDHAIRRRLASAAREIQQLASGPQGELETLLDEAEQKIFQIADKRREGALKPVRELLEPTLALLEKMQQGGGGITGLPTGFVDLDKQLTGFHPGELIILAARPGVGKTSLVMNIGVHVALNEKKPVGIFSLEMPSEQLLMRLLASHARIEMGKLRGGRMSQLDHEKFAEAAGELHLAPLYIDDTGSLTPFDLRSKARRLKQQYPDGLGLLIVDYLQLMSSPTAAKESRQLEISQISRSLKQLAKELEVPIVALSQLSRKVEERKDGKPMLSDLRESGAIEQDADVVMFIHKENKDGEDGGGETDSGARRAIEVELIVAKQRNGPVGSIDLIFLGEYTRFESRVRGD